MGALFRRNLHAFAIDKDILKGTGGDFLVPPAGRVPQSETAVNDYWHARKTTRVDFIASPVYFFRKEVSP